MRKRLCIGMILRSDDTVASGGTLSTMLRIGLVARDLGIEQVDFIPLMGAGKDLARAEVLAAFKHQSQAEDLLWIDFGNAIPGANLDAVAALLEVMLTSEKDALYCPYSTRGGDRFSFTCSLPDGQAARAHLVHEDLDGLGTVRLVRLGGCGFGMVRIRRSAVDRLFAHYADRAFMSDKTDFGELACVDVFSSTLARRGEDKERPSDRPMRLLPEDDSFWKRARDAGVEAFALVDFPSAHGKVVPGFNAPTFARYYGLPEAVGEDEAPSVLLDASGRPAARGEA